MTLTNPMPFVEAVKTLLGKDVMPTTLSSAELRGVDASLRRQSVFSARNHISSVLDAIKAATESVLNPREDPHRDRETNDNPEGMTTIGFNPATARESIRDSLKAAGLEINPHGGITDLTSNQRINLVVSTNVAMAQNAGHEIEANSSAERVADWPAWELIRFEQRRVPRGQIETKHGLEDDPENSWDERFRRAAEEVGDDDALRVLDNTGRRIAFKASPLWQALGDGAGGYEDTLGNSFAPYAFNSGEDRIERSREECVEVGLMEEDDKVQPAEIDFGQLFKTE